jgi:hypothetical protein
MRTPRRRATSACFLIAILLLIPVFALSAESGEWTLAPAGAPDRIQFSLQGSRSEGHYFNSSSDWSASDFHGIDWSIAGKHDVRFTITRDAGTFDCDGFIKDGAGAGLFTFRENPQYVKEMAALGFPLSSEDRQMSFAIHDISVAFARQIKSSGVAGVDTGKLIAFRIHGVTPQFIQEIRSLGLGNVDANKLIAFRIHGVSPEFIKSLRAAGIDTSNPDRLIAFRIHGVSPDYVHELARLGYSHPQPDELIALRIHGVTPDYIEKLKAHGVRNVTLRQLIALRIQGIE